MFTVNVEGNVGSGKSKLLEHFRSFDNVLVLEEDVDKWSNFHGLNLLELKFKNPEYYQFPFQSYATLTRLRQHLQASDMPIKIMERSLTSARKIFVETLKEMNQIHEAAYNVLQEYYDYIDEYHKIDCDLIIYIQVEPEVALKRINERARGGESTITIDYLKALHKRHEELFVEKAAALDAKVLIIDGNLPMEEMISEYKKCEQEIFRHLD